MRKDHLRRAIKLDKKKAMLSQPMRGKTDEEIIETRKSCD